MTKIFIAAGMTATVAYYWEPTIRALQFVEQVIEQLPLG